MSDRNVQSNSDYDGISGQPVRSYQSIWMARWTQTTSNLPPQMHSRLHPCTIKELSEVEMTSDTPRSANGFKEVKARTFGIVNDNVIMSLRSLRNEKLAHHSVQIVDLESGSPKSDKGSSHMQGSSSQFDHGIGYGTKALRTQSSHFPSALATNTSVGKYHIQPDPMEHANSHLRFADRSFSPSRRLEDDSIGPVSHTMPRKFERGGGGYKFDRRRHAVMSFMHRQEEIAFKENLSNGNMGILEQEHNNFNGVTEEEKGDCLDYGKSASPYASQSRATLLPVAPSSFKKMFPSQSSPSEMFRSEKLHHEDSMLKHKGPSVRDERLKTCTSLNSVGGLTEFPPGFSQTTRGFLIPEENNVDMCDETKILREPVLTRFEGNTSSGTRSFFPLFGNGKQGVMLHPLRISTDSEEEENVQDVKVSGVPNNESSAETDTMDMDCLKENPIAGIKSSQSNKVISMDRKFPAEEEAAGRRLIPELLDINIKLPALPDFAISVDNQEPCTSRTQSLDMELMLPASKETSNSKSIHCPIDPMESDPSSRWIKRLKLSSSNRKDFVGTTSSKHDELTHEKGNKFFEIMKGSITSTSEVVALEPAKRDDGISLSHPWIQRWIGHQNQPPTQQKKVEPVVVCEPQSSNLEDFPKKHFPSTAAMALMGKALSGFKKCEIEKRESFVVWKTKGF